MWMVFLQEIVSFDRLDSFSRVLVFAASFMVLSYLCVYKWPLQALYDLFWIRFGAHVHEDNLFSVDGVGWELLM